MNLKCAYCKREFEKFDKPKYHGKRKRSVRPSNSITCSKICSRKYAELRNRQKYKNGKK